MGCNCGKKTNTESYIFRDLNGVEKPYRTQQEANQALARAGGGVVKAVPAK